MNITDIKGTVTLHNGVEMPYFGLGVYQSREGKEVTDAVQWALEAGYRHIDTAAFYQNEEGVGKAVRQSAVDRDEVFVVTKVWNQDQGYQRTLKAFDTSLMKLGLDYLDMYLVHWPVRGLYRDTWRALEELYLSGRVRAIGVSNFLQHHLEDLMAVCQVRPMVNQMEFHPRLVQQSLIDYCHTHQVRYEAWSPMMQGRVFGLDALQGLAARYGKDAGQVVLRWNLQKGVVTIPKSARKERIISNSQVFDFALTDEEMAYIDSLDAHERLGPDPDTFDF